MLLWACEYIEWLSYGNNYAIDCLITMHMDRDCSAIRRLLCDLKALNIALPGTLHAFHVNLISAAFFVFCFAFMSQACRVHLAGRLAGVHSSVICGMCNNLNYVHELNGTRVEAATRHNWSTQWGLSSCAAESSHSLMSLMCRGLTKKCPRSVRDLQQLHQL